MENRIMDVYDTSRRILKIDNSLEYHQAWKIAVDFHRNEFLADLYDALKSITEELGRQRKSQQKLLGLLYGGSEEETT